MKIATLVVDGMHCKSCELLIADSLKYAGVEKVFFEKNRVKVFFEESKIKLQQVKETIRNEGYKVV